MSTTFPSVEARSNTPHFVSPNNDANSEDFGRITQTQGDDAFGRSREIRFGLRFSV
jgi:hypothetical protein